MAKGIYLLLGSNIGDKRQQLVTAIEKINKNNRIFKQSSIYKTTAWGNADQSPFYNQVVQINTFLEPAQLLTDLLRIEKEMGRIREGKWRPRIIDIDILYYNDAIIETKQLTIPHPEIQNRRFTLVPLVEISPEFSHPILKKNQKELLHFCMDMLEVSILLE